MKLLLFTQDLMIGSRVEGAARQHGLKLVTIGNQAGVVEAAGDAESLVLIVDLQVSGLDIGALVTAVRGSREPSVPIVAFGPHVHEARLEAARAANCDAVLTRGQLDREVGNVVGALLNKN